MFKHSLLTWVTQDSPICWAGGAALLSNELNILDYVPNMTRMFGSETLNNAISTITGEVRFMGLTSTNMKLEGLDKHLKLIESYQKLQVAKRKFKTI